MGKPKIKIAVTAGDPAGIGPEVVIKAINELTGLDITLVVIGRYEILQKNYPKLISKLANRYKIVQSDDELSQCISSETSNLFFYNLASDFPIPVPGIGNPDTGHESRTYIDLAVRLWQSNMIDGIVTGPVNKGFIQDTSFRFTGHTEYIADLINEDNPYMLMYSPDYRVLLVTSHISVAEISESIDADKIFQTILIGHKAIGSIDRENIKIAITGLDPHCGDNGAIGNFDMNVTKTAVRMAMDQGIDISGPYAADTIFLPEKWKSFNLVIAHYHDQGLIPFKTLAFDLGVNVTLGLSLIRTSPDHGTAYDIAGKGLANPSSMMEAIKLAYRLVLDNKI